MELFLKRELTVVLTFEYVDNINVKAAHSSAAFLLRPLSVMKGKKQEKRSIYCVLCQ